MLPTMLEASMVVAPLSAKLTVTGFTLLREGARAHGLPVPWLHYLDSVTHVN